METNNRTNQTNSIQVIRNVFRRQYLKSLGLFSLYIILDFIGLFAIFYFYPESKNEFTGILAIGAGGIFFFVSFFHLIKAIIKLIIGPPKANNNKERTIRQYYSNCLIAAGSSNLNKVRVESLCFLSPDTINSVNGWEGFSKYWSQKNLEILEELRKHISFEGTRFGIGEIKYLQQDDILINFEINITFVGESGLGTTQSPKHKTKPILFKVANEIIRLENNWYIKNFEWNGQLILNYK